MSSYRTPAVSLQSPREVYKRTVAGFTKDKTKSLQDFPKTKIRFMLSLHCNPAIPAGNHRDCRWLYTDLLGLHMTPVGFAHYYSLVYIGVMQGIQSERECMTSGK